MADKEKIRRIRERRKADQARFDEVTRRLKERIERYRSAEQREREGG